MEIDLKPFCHEDEGNRYGLSDPWVAGGFKCATDTRIVIRVPCAEPDTKDDRKRPGVSKMDFSRCAVAGSSLDLSDVFVGPNAKCLTCKATGFVDGIGCPRCRKSGSYECGECYREKECDDCNGNGYTGEIKCHVCCGTKCTTGPERVRIKGQWFNMEYIDLIKDLPGLAVDVIEAAPMAFRFDGGEGLLMPMHI